MPAVLEPIPPVMLDLPTLIKDLEGRTFAMPDARHIEDCMLYHGVAARVAQEGDDLERVRRLFRWIVAQVELVPTGALASPRLPHVWARPFDVLVRGLAVEDNRFWAERSWLFMVLCRQIGVDVGMLTFTPQGAKEPASSMCTALIDGKLYLFDAQIGLEVPGPGGTGVATLDDALRDPTVLARLDLPGQSSYDTSRDALRASASKIGILIDSSSLYSAPRMALLQENLAGRNRTTLYCDPAAQRDRFVRALGPHAGTVTYWPLPMQVEFRLFHDGKFVDATAQSLFFFDPKLFPLVYARVKQLRGELPEAIQQYVDLRFVENPMFLDKRAKLPAEFQQALDAYATYFLGLCCLEQGRAKEAERFFEQTLKMLPEPSRDQPFYTYFRWGAETNLGRLLEARGDDARAIAYYSQYVPTAQRHGNLVRARELLWQTPIADLPPALPAAPTPAPQPPPFLAAPR
jgi:tetratricopeptide (TPR) repeat protein